MGVPRVLASILVLGVGLGLPVVADAAATFSIINLDTANVGLNDATSFTPQGGNSATTLGQARLNVLAEAGRIWGQRLTSSQTILVDAQMSADTCTSTSATLASAGPATFFTDSATPSILFPAALAHAQARGRSAQNRRGVGE